MEIKPIAYIHTPFSQKFGIPRQSGLADEIIGTIEFVPPYRDAKALEGLENYDYLWLLWEFEDVTKEDDSEFRAQVRPPRLGGNEYVGVFATRSPFRPNPIGLSCVRIISIDPEAENGPLILVSGADLRDNTPIFDIKPYLPYVEAHPEARGGFTDYTRQRSLEVKFAEGYLEELDVCDRELFEADKKNPLMQVLSQDPRPAYQRDNQRVYGMNYYDYNIEFKVIDDVVIVQKCKYNIG